MNKVKRIYHHLLSQKRLLARRGVVNTIKYNKQIRMTNREARRNRSYYSVLTENDIPALRKSEKIFVFGSGYSLNLITPEKWNYISRHDTMGFNAFVYQNWIRTDFHLVRGWCEGANVAAEWKELTDDFSGLVNKNPHYSKTVFIMQDDYSAQFAHSLLKYKSLPQDNPLIFFCTDTEPGCPSRRLKDGLKHKSGTLCDAVNFAYAGGWKEIILVGVDLYDSRYFWLKENETFAVDEETGERMIGEKTDRGQRYDQPHSTATKGMIDLMADWGACMAETGVSLSVYNPKSLLAEKLPVFTLTEE